MLDFFSKNIPFVIVLFLSFISVAIFLYRLRYMRDNQIKLWGIFLTLDFIITLGIIYVSFGGRNDLLPLANLSNNLMQVIQFAIVLIILFSRNIAKPAFFYIAFGVYFLIWLVEFWGQMPLLQKVGFQALRYLKVAPVFFRMVLIIGILLYWTNIYHKKETGYFKDPVFILTLGMFIFYSLTSIGYFYDAHDVEIANDSWLKQVHDFINTQFQISDIIGYIFYILAFWKTKQWAEYHD